MIKLNNHLSEDELGELPLERYFYNSQCMETHPSPRTAQKKFLGMGVSSDPTLVGEGTHHQFITSVWHLQRLNINASTFLPCRRHISLWNKSYYMSWNTWSMWLNPVEGRRWEALAFVNLHAVICTSVVKKQSIMSCLNTL